MCPNSDKHCLEPIIKQIIQIIHAMIKMQINPQIQNILDFTLILEVGNTIFIFTGMTAEAVDIGL